MEKNKEKYLTFSGYDLLDEFGFDEVRVSKLRDEGYITDEAWRVYCDALDEAEFLGIYE